MKKNKEINKKFVLVGDGYCGKSTLIAAFYNRKFVEKYTPTIFDTFTVQTDIYKKQVNLEICDSAGQEEFSRVRPLSYPDVDAIILCFSIDSRESSTNILELWLPEIKHFCTNKAPVILVGCKIDLRKIDRTTTGLNRHFMLKQEHLNNINRINSFTNSHANSSLYYGLFKNQQYCCRHGRPCTCYHSRICSTNCIGNSSIKHKSSKLSSSSNCLITTPTKNNRSTVNVKDNIIRCNRMLLEQQSPTRNSTNTEDSFSSSEGDVEELQSNTMSNTMSNSSCSLNGPEKNSHYNNSIYRHNQSMLNTLIHQQIEHQQQYSNSLNSSETDERESESEITSDNQDDQQVKQINNGLIHTNLLDSYPARESSVDHISSLSIDQTKSQPQLVKNLKFGSRCRLFKGYKSFVNNSNVDNTTALSSQINKVSLDLSNNKSTLSLKDRKLFKNSSLKHKLSAMLGVNSSPLDTSIYPSKSEKKLTNVFYNRKLCTSNSSIPFQSLIYKTDHHKTEQSSTNSPFITTEEGLRLCAKIGAQAYVECSSKMNIGVDEVFRTALKLSIKHPSKLDMCSLS